MGSWLFRAEKTGFYSVQYMAFKAYLTKAIDISIRSVNAKGIGYTKKMIDTICRINQVPNANRDRKADQTLNPITTLLLEATWKYP